MPPRKKSIFLEKAMFKKGQTGNPRGSSEKQRHLKEVAAMTAQQMAQVGTILVTSHLDDLHAIIKDPNSTVLQVWIATIVIRSMNTGDHASFTAITNRIVGKPRETIEVSGPDKGPIDMMSDMEKKTRLASIMAQAKMLGDD